MCIWIRMNRQQVWSLWSMYNFTFNFTFSFFRAVSQLLSFLTNALFLPNSLWVFFCSNHIRHIQVALCQRVVSQISNFAPQTLSRCILIVTSNMITWGIILRWIRVPSMEGTWIYLGASCVRKRDRLRSIDSPWSALCYTHSDSTNTRHSMWTVYLGWVSQSPVVDV